VTSQDHNKVIGIMHLIWGGFNALMMLLFVPFIIIILGPMGSDPTAPPELKTVFAAFGVLIVLFTLVFSIPPLLAGYAMLRRKRWARVMGIIAGCFEALSMPFGTALCVYTLWFMFGQGESFYHDGGNMAQDWRRNSLRDASTFNWEAHRAQQQHQPPREYAPPPQPPDWRGQ
jgi:hypothetical protein